MKTGKSILEIAEKQILLLDGAMGSAIQDLELPEKVYNGKLGCNEYLVISKPEAIVAIHESFYEAGADIAETNTFGANPGVLKEYDISDKTEEINIQAALLARTAADKYSTPGKPRFVSGSIGPGTKLPSLSQITYDALFNGYVRQITGLIKGGVDMLQIETCQDLLQTKAALAAAFDVMEKNRRVPVFVSLTVEQTGTMLTGTDITTAITILSPFEIDILGLNCATGPAAMRTHIETLASKWKGLIGMYPNAGLPVPGVHGVSYPESPEEFAGTIGRFINELPINIVGGCCGTTPAHIRRVADFVAGKIPLHRNVNAPKAVASLFSSFDVRQDPPPFFFGERANATGSKAFRDALLSGDYDKAIEILCEQEERGSHAADLSVAYAGLDELRDMEILVSRAAKECKAPLMIDSNNTGVVEAALKRYAGRAVVNSINLEDGGARAGIVCRLAKRFGAAVVCLTIDETGMAMTTDKKVEVAVRLADLCVKKHGFRPSDLYIDTLTFTIGSGDPALKNAAVESLNAIKKIKAEMPEINCILGLSNISYGLSMKSRVVLNSVFLFESLRYGLDAAILNPKHIIPLAELDETDVTMALNLIYNRNEDGKDALEAFIEYFSGRADIDDPKEDAGFEPRDAVFYGIIKGKAAMLEKNISSLLMEESAEDILNNILVPAMKNVGDLFGSGRLQLPFVLKSAEVMKKAVDMLKPFFKGDSSGKKAKKLLMATVRGDVHDIGKNLAGIIVSSNGYEVIDLGVKVPVEVIISESRKRNPDAIGMSGLLVSSAMIMGENLRAMSDAGITLPVLVGGAALTPKFVADVLKPAYKTGSVTYCSDAFAGLTAMQAISQGKIPGTPEPAVRSAPADDSPPLRPMEIETIAPPLPPFVGFRHIHDVMLDSFYSLVNEAVLFRGRWGYRRRDMPAEEFKKLTDDEVIPKYIELKRIVKAEKIFEPKIAYGYFKCRSDGNRLHILDGNKKYTFEFPRRAAEPRISIPDFFRTDEDIAGFFVVTLGDNVKKRGEEILLRSKFLDYFLFNGFAVEVADALAEYCHARMRYELGIGDDKRLTWSGAATQKFRSCRYAFGYPACPDLSANKIVSDLVQAGGIGVSITESYQMTPEFSTSAIIVHHPKAGYFSI